MDKREQQRFRKMAVEQARAQWGKEGWRLLSDAQRKAFIGERAALIVLSQAMDRYAPAQELLRACMSDEEE